MAHEADRGFIHHLVQYHQVVVLQLTISPMEMVVEELEQLVVLLCQVGEIDEESATHVSFHRLYGLGPCRSVVFHKEIAILQ